MHAVGAVFALVGLTGSVSAPAGRLACAVLTDLSRGTLAVLRTCAAVFVSPCFAHTVSTVVALRTDSALANLPRRTLAVLWARATIFAGVTCTVAARIRRRFLHANRDGFPNIFALKARVTALLLRRTGSVVTENTLVADLILFALRVSLTKTIIATSAYSFAGHPLQAVGCGRASF